MGVHSRLSSKIPMGPSVGKRFGLGIWMRLLFRLLALNESYSSPVNGGTTIAKGNGVG